MFNFFRKKQNKETKRDSLDIAQEQNLISLKELLKLRIDRAEEDYKDYLLKEKTKK